MEIIEKKSADRGEEEVRGLELAATALLSRRSTMKRATSGGVIEFINDLLNKGCSNHTLRLAESAEVQPPLCKMILCANSKQSNLI